MLKSVTAEERMCAGGHRNSAVSYYYTHPPDFYTLCVYNIVSVVCLQRCSVRTVWFMRPVVLPVLRRVPALLRSLSPSVAPSPVWRDVSVLTAL